MEEIGTMPEEIGVIEEIHKGHSAVNILGIQIRNTTPDRLRIAKFYEPTWRNLFRYAQIGNFKVSRPHDYKERDVVKVVINDKRIESVAKVGNRLSKKGMLLHDASGQGAIALGIVVIILAIIVGW